MEGMVWPSLPADKRPYISDSDMAIFVARSRKTAALYGEKVLAFPLSNADFRTRFKEGASPRRMNGPPDGGKIYVGWLVVRKLGTSNEYETWMGDDVFDELCTRAS